MAKLSNDRLDKFRPQTRNANKHTQRGMGALEAAMRKYGYVAPMTAAADGEILDGSARIETSANVFGDDVIVVHHDGTKPVIMVRDDIPSGDTPQAREISIAANRIAQFNLDFDAEVILGDLQAGVDLEQFWRKDELDELLADLQPKATEGDTPAEVDRAEELRQKWGTAAGQLWQLGEHRLICGDCTDAATVARVMGGEKAQAVVTDPPYGINREGIPNDDPGGLRALFDGCLAAMPVTDAVMIAFQSPRLFPVWLDSLREAGGIFERALWFYDETDVTFPWRGWLMTSQVALVSSIGKPQWNDKGPYHHDCYIVKTAGKQDDSGGHTTAKPFDVITDLVAHTTGVVYEPFAGSGTTGVACQQLGRRARMVEIDPKYCAVILERFDKMGVTPTLIEQTAGDHVGGLVAIGAEGDEVR